MGKYLVFFFTLLSCGYAFSASFPTNAQIELISDFSGGLNTTSPSHKIPKNFSPRMRNVFIHRQPGKIIKRSGFVVAGSSFVLMNGRFMFTFNKENGDKEFIVSDDSIVLTTKDFQTYIFISSALNNTVHLNATQARNKVWFTNGIDPVFTWDGTVKQILDGTLGTPNVPRFRYFTTFQERIFGLNTSANGSLLQWTDVASTAGIAIAPDNFLAWPVLNALNIGQGDGQVGTALWVFRGQPQVGKERSIYTIFNSNNSNGTANFVARQTVKQAGVSSNDSVVVLDGLTYYKGYDGIYAYDGSASIAYNSEGTHGSRISDTIVPDVTNMLDAANQIRENSWETATDFQRGQVQGTTITPDGFLTLVPVTISTNISPNAAHIFNTPPGANPLTASNTFYGPIFVNFGTTVTPDSARFYTSLINLTLNSNASCSGSPMIKTLIDNLYTGENITYTNSLIDGGQFANVAFSSQAPVFDGWQVNRSSYSLKFEFASYQACPTGGISINLDSATFTLTPATTGQYISDIATNSIVTAWGILDSVRNLNTSGGTINYYVKTGTSSVNIATRTWSAITPGVTLNQAPSETFVQWAATITSVNQSTNSYPFIDNVTISHIEGSGSRDRPFAIDWKNEYWLSIATETSGMFSLQYVKSWITNPNPNAWMVLDSMNIRSFCKDGITTLYGGSASTGTFFRLDYGTNDNGKAIDASYETADLVLKGALFGGQEGNWMEEQLHEIWIDADAENGSRLMFGVSTNGGAFVDNIVDLSGTGRILKVLYNQNSFGKFFRFRVRNNVLDDELSINNLATVYQPLQTR